MYEHPHPHDSTIGDSATPTPELHLAASDRPLPSPETMLHALYAVSAIGHRFPSYQGDGDRAVDRSLARIRHHFVSGIVVEHGFAPDTRLGLRVLRLCQQSVAYADGTTSAALN